MEREPWQATRARQHARKATLTTCRKCGAEIYRGLDDDLAAVTVQIETTPISLLDESKARQAGWDTFNLAGGEIVYRNIEQLAAVPPRWPVHAEHTCPPGADRPTFDVPAQSRPACLLTHLSDTGAYSGHAAHTGQPTPR